MGAGIHSKSEDWANIFSWELFRWNRTGMLPVKKLSNFFDLFSSRNRAILERDTIFENDLCLKIVSFLEENKLKFLLDIYFTGSRPMRFQRNNSHAKIFAQSSDLRWITASIGSKCSCRKIFSVRTAVLYIIDALGCPITPRVRT